jgi:hypothetical protein
VSAQTWTQSELMLSPLANYCSDSPELEQREHNSSKLKVMCTLIFVLLITTTTPWHDNVRNMELLRTQALQVHAYDEFMSYVKYPNVAAPDFKVAYALHPTGGTMMAFPPLAN